MGIFKWVALPGSSGVAAGVDVVDVVEVNAVVGLVGVVIVIFVLGVVVRPEFKVYLIEKSHKSQIKLTKLISYHMEYLKKIN